MHAGAGAIAIEISKEQELDCKEALNHALQAGYNILKNRGTSLDAIEAAIKIMEDFPYFNAGREQLFLVQAYANLMRVLWTVEIKELVLSLVLP